MYLRKKKVFHLFYQPATPTIETTQQIRKQKCEYLSIKCDIDVSDIDTFSDNYRPGYVWRRNGMPIYEGNSPYLKVGAFL